MRIFIILFGLTFFSTLGKAQIICPAELTDLVNKSFTFFPKIKEVENEVLSSKEKLSVNLLNNKPDITFNGSYNFIMPKISFPINGKEIQFAPVNNFNGTFGSSYTLLDFGRYKANITKSKSEIQLSESNVSIAKNELAYQVTSIYFDMVYIQKAMAIQDSIINYLKVNKKIAEGKLKNGDLLQTDIYNIQSNIDAEENKKLDLLTVFMKQSNLLLYTTGIDSIHHSTFMFDTPMFTDKDSIKTISQILNPELKQIDNKISIAKNEWEATKLNNKPTVSLHGATGIKNGYVPNVNEMRFNYMAGIAIAVPIYSFGKHSELLKLKQTLVKQAELLKESKDASLDKDINQAFIDVEMTTERLKNVESQIFACKKSQEITVVKYQNGVATYLDVLTAAANFQRAALTKLNYEFQLCQSKIELAKLTGIQFWKN